ncbi:IS110 family transposase, partial [Pseudomonas syringae pv. actinidifoliorum]|nr:IS110 family transposase [Pseudomonas syringae pv. actinidifoliorum]
MAMRVSKSVIGVDVAKIELVTYQADSDLLAL